MNVTIPQALALQSMFDYWNQLSSLGGSREVSFYCDGDGNFHPNISISFNGASMPKLTNDLKQLAITKNHDGNRLYDYDAIAWKLGDTVGGDILDTNYQSWKNPYTQKELKVWYE